MAELHIRIDGTATMKDAAFALKAFTDHTMQLAPTQTVDRAFDCAVVRLYDAANHYTGDARMVRDDDDVKTVDVRIQQSANLETLHDLTVNLIADLTSGVIDQALMPDSRSRFSTLITWANEFNKIHAGKEWDGEYFEAVDDFYATKRAKVLAGDYKN